MSVGKRRKKIAAQCPLYNNMGARFMDMADSTLWWLLAGVAIALELVTGTFYLLMLSVGLMAGAISAHLGASFTWQMVIAALVGASFVVGWRRYKQQSPQELPAQANANVNPDIGETVSVAAWDADGRTNVKYRGANWSAALAPNAEPRAGLHRIVEVVGNRLILTPV